MTVAEHERIWSSVDAITKARRVKLERDDAAVDWAWVPSLWSQAMEALYGSGEPGNGGASQPARERSVLDLDLLEVTRLIRETVAFELRRRALYGAEAPTPQALRALASWAVGRDREHWPQWEDRFAAWARILSGHLHVGEHQPAAVRLRNTPCPACGVRQVVITTAEGARVVPALVVDFAEGLVRAAQCGACGQAWWRGAELECLASLLA